MTAFYDKLLAEALQERTGRSYRAMQARAAHRDAPARGGGGVRLPSRLPCTPLPSRAPDRVSNVPVR